MEKKVFKNWPAICAIQDKFVKWALAMLNLHSDVGKRFAEQLPEYFTTDEVFGSVPLSVIRKQAHENAVHCGDDGSGEEHPCSYGAIPIWIPVFTFDKFGRKQVSCDAPNLPSEISPDAEQGEVVTWEGKKFVVLENNESCEELHIAPAELIDVDCPVRIPLSALMDAAEECSREEWSMGSDAERTWVADRHFALTFGGKKYPQLRFPIAHRFGNGEPPLPKKVIEQLIDQKAQAGIVVTYRGKEYLVVMIDFCGDESPQIGSVIDNGVVDKISSLSLANAELVNLNR